MTPCVPLSVREWGVGRWVSVVGASPLGAGYLSLRHPAPGYCQLGRFSAPCAGERLGGLGIANWSLVGGLNPWETANLADVRPRVIGSKVGDPSGGGRELPTCQTLGTTLGKISQGAPSNIWVGLVGYANHLSSWQFFGRQIGRGRLDEAEPRPNCGSKFERHCVAFQVGAPTLGRRCYAPTEGG